MNSDIVGDTEVKHGADHRKSEDPGLSKQQGRSVDKRQREEKTTAGVDGRAEDCKSTGNDRSAAGNTSVKAGNAKRGKSTAKQKTTCLLSYLPSYSDVLSLAYTC